VKQKARHGAASTGGFRNRKELQALCTGEFKKNKRLESPFIGGFTRTKNSTPLFPVTREFQQKPHTNVLIHTVKISQKTIEIA